MIKPHLLTLLGALEQSSTYPETIAALKALFAALDAPEPEVGYRVASIVHGDLNQPRALQRCLSDLRWADRDAFDTAIASLPVCLVSLEEGPLLHINTACFPEDQAITIAYCDDVGSRTQVIGGLEAAGSAEFAAEPYMWLRGQRHCTLFRVVRGADATPRLLSKSVGEFCMEVWHARADGAFTVLYRNDFTLK